jgi:MerR family transcriptional regulator/heat shock protein HspR
MMDERSDRADEQMRQDPNERAVYVISVAAELAGVHPQTLRIYERKGLLRPQRTSGNTRRYSDRDIALLQQIHEMTQERGINLAGVKRIIELQAQLAAMRRRTAELEERLRASRRAAERARERGATGGEILPLDSIVLPPWETR